MRNWYTTWLTTSRKHRELLREAERERLFNRLRSALQTASTRREEASRTCGNTSLVAERLRPAER